MTEAEKIVITKYDLLYEQRMTRVETNLENIGKSIERLDKDFRLIIIIMLGGFGSTFAMITGIFALMAHGFHWY
jgi:hypothetical protein